MYKLKNVYQEKDYGDFDSYNKSPPAGKSLYDHEEFTTKKDKRNRRDDDDNNSTLSQVIFDNFL